MLLVKMPPNRAERQSYPVAVCRSDFGEGLGNAKICQPNRGKNLKMPKMPKSVQFRPEPAFSTPPIVPRMAGFAAGQMGQTEGWFSQTGANVATCCRCVAGRKAQRNPCKIRIVELNPAGAG
jgi:hypothetical protein